MNERELLRDMLHELRAIRELMEGHTERLKTIDRKQDEDREKNDGRGRLHRESAEGITKSVRELADAMRAIAMELSDERELRGTFSGAVDYLHTARKQERWEAYHRCAAIFHMPIEGGGLTCRVCQKSWTDENLHWHDDNCPVAAIEQWAEEARGD